MGVRTAPERAFRYAFVAQTIPVWRQEDGSRSVHLNDGCCAVGDRRAAAVVVAMGYEGCPDVPAEPLGNILV